MASISTPISTFSPSFSLLQKPRITNQSSPVLRLPSMSKRPGKIRCSIEGKPAITSDDSAQPGGEDRLIITGKSSWPELVGKKGEVAKAIIEKENPVVTAYVILEGTPIPLDYRTDRVWVVVNSEDVVILTPTIG
ncbi:subtilisin-chymotrypsin inhibitor-2A-like [Bidens hawaiensis]|uniref:subtilisin-chymotrypsin inhibitor-2A-like n=1 Tax=Bidens hawaiensis TaxID=980011 RepID=UPI00404B7584